MNLHQYALYIRFLTFFIISQSHIFLLKYVSFNILNQNFQKWPTEKFSLYSASCFFSGKQLLDTKVIIWSL